MFFPLYRQDTCSHFYWQVINLYSAEKYQQPYVCYRILHTDTLWQITIWFPDSKNANKITTHGFVEDTF